MSYYCDVCSLDFTCKGALTGHASGKKHKKRLEYVQLIERSVVVSPLPKSICQFALFDFFQQYGTIRWHRLGPRFLIMEFNDRKSTEALLKEPVWLNNVKLNIRRRRLNENVGKSNRAKQNSPTENACPISYNKIKHIFEEKTTFDNQLVAFLNAVQLTDAEIETRYECIITQLDEIFKPLFPKCKSYKFGSTQTGLGFKECDLDIYMDIGEPIVETRSPSAWTMFQIFKKVNSLMHRMHHVFSHIILIPKAKMPIIKFCYIQTNVFCDISFKNSLGIHKSYLLKYYISLDDRVRSLMMLIKYWARHFKVSGTGKMSSFALMLLIIFYLQQPSVNIVPPLTELQRTCQPLIINGWQVNFNENVTLPPITNTNSISQLLHGFFSFYATFEFKSFVICPLDGLAHNKSEFKDTDSLPRCMDRYNACVQMDENLKLNLNRPMCVQDPIELCYNVTAITQLTRLNSFVQYCAIGAEICATSSQNDYRDLLGTLFTTVVKTKTTKDTFIVTIPGKDFVRANESNEMETCTDGVEKGKFTKSDWYFTVFNIVRDILEKVFKVQVEIVSDNVAEKQQKLEMLSDVHTEKHQLIVLSCTGSHRVWYKRKLSNMVFDPCLSCLEKEALMSEKTIENYDKEGSPQKVNLEFMCEFQKTIQPPKVTLVISNENSDRGVFRDFASFARSKLCHITQRTLTHMQQFNKRY